MDIQGDNYNVSYDPSTATIICSGSLHLYGNSGYEAIVELFDNVVDQSPNNIILDVKELRLLNSSGINVIFKFVINVRNKGASKIIVIGSEQFAWQKKTLKNLQKLMPDLELEFE